MLDYVQQQSKGAAYSNCGFVEWIESLKFFVYSRFIEAATEEIRPCGKAEIFQGQINFFWDCYLWKNMLKDEAQKDYIWGYI